MQKKKQIQANKMTFLELKYFSIIIFNYLLASQIYFRIEMPRGALFCAWFV